MLNTNLKNQTLSVSQFNQLIDEIISPLQVIVEGELSGVNTNSGRWFFAVLKDDQASVNIFSPLGRIPNWQVLQEGMRVRVDGWPRLYQKTGRFSLFARSIQPAGRGALKEAYEKLKKDLEVLGYFDPARKRPLPRLIRKIGLITAPGSRAYSDFISVLADQSSGIKIDFYPVLVQGDEAVDQISQALDFFNQRAKDYDLLVLTRGGGSLEDLLPFNSRILVEAVYGAKVPVLAAIGHEADDCLIDLVADFRSSTPSAAAQLINQHQREALLTIDSLAQRLIDSYQDQILIKRGDLNSFANRLTFYYQNQFQEISLLLARFDGSISSFLRQIQVQEKIRRSLEKLLLSYDHRTILKRGFTLTLDRRAKIITEPGKVLAGEEITTRFYQGEILSEVKNK
ncbi:MAG: exodeoxyribonuclease VII large subunit [Candidatus Shapirobacteria bacterium]|nr:exodeoxyribonuclease VII large subunit [Candidatus Shapirobacteria bacterium]MDD5073836.1 exodeoxyribonuclease VII large subunit [Candidatus Shapirobacteria bacterium]MDD5481818.1 exodeoxyribonuclease VII large subunit [Candidatus Shapirobacteria bacterium]